MKVHSVLFLVGLTIIHAAPVTADQELDLRAAIASHRYCPVDKDVIVLLVKFKIRLTNGGNAAVVVGQQPYPLLLMSRRREDLEKGKHEFELHPPDIFPQSPESSRKRRDARDTQRRFSTDRFSKLKPWR